MNKKKPVRWYVIINPVSGARSGLRAWKSIKPMLEKAELSFVSRITEFHRHSTELLRDALLQGFRNFICIGGDGTFHNMVNGLMRQKLVESTDVVFLVISVGTGNDWIRSHNVPANPQKAVDLITNGKIVTQDVGKVVFGKKEERRVRFFHNFAGVGFDAYVVEHTKKLKEMGQLAYLFGVAKSLFSYSCPLIKFKFDDREIEEKVLFALSGIGKYGGGGMQLTPSAIPDDGLFDLTLVKDFSKLEVFFNIHRLYNGSVMGHKKVEGFRTDKIHIEANGENGVPVMMEADGELIGEGPFNMEIIPVALKVLVPK